MSAVGKTKTAWLVTAPFSLSIGPSFFRPFENVLINKVCARGVLGPAGVADQFPAAFSVAVQHGFAFGIVGGAGAVFPAVGGGGTAGQQQGETAAEKNLTGEFFHKTLKRILDDNGKMKQPRTWGKEKPA